MVALSSAFPRHRPPNSEFKVVFSSDSWAVLQQLSDLRPVHANVAEVLLLHVSFEGDIFVQEKEDGGGGGGRTPGISNNIA